MRRAAAPGRASSSRTYGFGVRLMTGWLDLYTRRVDPRFRDERESATMFELWEHAIASDRARRSGPLAAADLVLRAAAATPRDVAWRHAVLTGRGASAFQPARLLGRHRPHTRIPLQEGRPFDQTNGMIAPEQALPYEPRNDSFGAAGNVIGLQGGF